MKLFRPLLLICLSAALAFSAFVFVPLVGLGTVAFAQSIVPPPALVTQEVVADLFKVFLVAMLVLATCLLIIRLVSRLRWTPEPMPFDGGFTDAWRATDPDPGRRR